MNDTYERNEKAARRFEPPNPEETNNKGYINTRTAEVNGNISYFGKKMNFEILKNLMNNLMRNIKLKKLRERLYKKFLMKDFSKEKMMRVKYGEIVQLLKLTKDVDLIQIDYLILSESEQSTLPISLNILIHKYS